MKKGIIVLGAGPMQIPALTTARELGLFVIAADKNPHAEGFPIADVSVAIDIKDRHALSDWAEEHRDVHNIAAVFSGADVAVSAAAINERLGLKGIPFDVALASNNKAVMKQKWIPDNVSTPRSIEVDNYTDALSAAKEIGYPLIVKAIDNAASRGTQMLENPEGLSAAVDNAKLHSTTNTCLIEEFVQGDEQSVETVMHKGRQIRAGIVDRHFGYLPYLIETGHTNPTALSKEVQEEIYRVVEEGAASLGISDGPAKADMIMTEKGPMILEMTARLSGGFHSQYTTPLALGMDPIRAVMRQSLGDPGFEEDLEQTRHRYSMCMAVFPEPGEVRAVEGYDEAMSIEGVHKILVFKKEGHRIEDYKTCADRPCYVIVSADDRHMLGEIFERVQRVLKFKMV